MANLECRQAVIVEPFRVEVRAATLPAPAANQIPRAHTGQRRQRRHRARRLHRRSSVAQRPEPARLEIPLQARLQCRGYRRRRRQRRHGMAARRPRQLSGNHASAELLTIGHERGKLWRLPDDLSFEKARSRVWRAMASRRRPRRPDPGPQCCCARPRDHRPIRLALVEGRRSLSRRRH